ncbi:hypothetical protein ACE0DR_25515 [Azotobacter sp. CWF10]
MNRRRFVSSIAAGIAGFELSFRTHAYQRCNQMGSCEVGIRFDKLQRTYASQEMSQWCWAATIEMIFNYYGYKVPQHKIVQQIYGGIYNLPALSGAVISSALSRRWTDDQGLEFDVQLQAAYDVDSSVQAIDNNLILTSLAQEIPLIYGNYSHAMVLTAAAFNISPMGPQIFNLGFMDPWPGRGLRGMDNPSELTPMHQGANSLHCFADYNCGLVKVVSDRYGLTLTDFRKF